MKHDITMNMNNEALRSYLKKKSDVWSVTTREGHSDIAKILLDKGANPKETEQTLKRPKDDIITSTSENLISLPEPTPDAAGEAERMIEIVKGQHLEDFKTLEKKLSTTAVSILHIVAVYGCSEMVECMKNWDGIQWDEQCELSEFISEDALEDIRVRKATALYIATSMDKTKMACSLIKCAGEDNIRCCYQNIQLSKSMEEVFMHDRVGKLERKHRDLDPVIVPGHRVGKDRKRERIFIVYSKDVMKPSSDHSDELGSVLIRNPYFISGESKSDARRQIGVLHDDNRKAQKALSIYRKKLWATHSNLNVIRIHSVTFRNNIETNEQPCLVLYCSSKGIVPLGEPDFPKRLKIDEHDSVDVIVREGYFRRGSGYATQSSVAYHNTLKMGCNIGRLNLEEGQKPLSGTLGPFVRNKDNEVGFLTCAHVLFNIPNPSENFYFPDGASSTIEVAQPSPDIRTPSGLACGIVDKAIFDPGRDPSIDVAVVQLTDDKRIPTAGQFANAKFSKFEQAGFSELPEYNSGSCKTHLKEFATSQIVFKFGSSSDVTKGMLDMNGTEVRLLSTDITLPNCKKAFMTNQCTIFGSDPEFALGGDSGAPVFVKTPETNELSCIGIVIGNGYLAIDEDTKNYPVAVFTPIDAVMEALGDDYKIASFPAF